MYENVCIESLGYTLPEQIWSSAEIEARLEPLYQRLRLPPGRLELMTGIRERRVWAPGVLPSENSVRSCRLALEAAQLPPEKIGCLIHGSVCRDYLEPATACTVHDQLKLPTACQVFDVSNACLGLLNGMLQAGNMIELNQIEAALVVGSEGGRQLVENTISYLNSDHSLTRQTIKPAFASLTIGSASCAILLVHRSISRSQNRLRAAVSSANTRHNQLCESLHDQAGSSMTPLMQTNSEELLLKGVETGVETMRRFLPAATWSRTDIDKTICHQVGSGHRKLMLESLGIDPRIDYATFPWLGNTGSAALPVSLALASQTGFVSAGDRVALLGIGSGINCIMVAADWNYCPVRGNSDTSGRPGLGESS